VGGARALLAIPAPDLSSGLALADLLGAMGVYALRAVHPLPLSTAHPYAPGEPAALILGAVLVLVLALAATRARRLAVPAAIFVAGLLPASLALKNLGFAPERYFYLPSLGLALLAGEGLAGLRTVPRTARALGLAAATALLLLGLAPSATRVREWRTGASLFAATLRLDPADPQANLVLANEAGLAGRWTDARTMLERAQRRDPSSPRLANALARVLLEQGETALALSQASRATSLDPDRPQSWLYLAWAHHLAGDHARELAALDRALDLSPDYQEARAARERAACEVGEGPRCSRTR